MRKVYIDERLRKYVVPMELRNVSKSEGKSFTPGTRISLPEDTKFVRLFTAWATKSGKQGSIDVDLGGAFIKEENGGLKMTSIAYYNQSDEESIATHSGDFTSCREFNPKEHLITAEYIDVDIEKSRQAGYKYALTAEFIYSGAEDYDDMQAWSGVQLLSDMRTEKKQFVNLNDSLFKVKLGGAYQSHTALAIDFDTKEIVILDQYSEERSGINIHSMAGKMNEFKKLYFNAQEFQENVFDLISMYCEANNFVRTEDINSADIICSYDDYKDKAANQVMFNVSNELENIIDLLN
jgi:hypothetical protein